MKNFMRTHRILFPVLIALLAVMLVGGTVMALTGFSTDITVTGTVNTLWSLSVVTDGSTGCTATNNTGGSPYPSGTVVSITATVGPGYIFTGWTVPSGAGIFGNASYLSTTFTTDSAATVVQANFIPTVAFPLYTDLNCTQLFNGVIDLGTVNIVDGQTVTITTVLYFKANKSRLVPGGYGSGDVNPYTVFVTGYPDIGGSYMVGEPFGSMAWHPCMLTISFHVGEGAPSPFNFTVTANGTDDLSIN